MKLIDEFEDAILSAQIGNAPEQIVVADNTPVSDPGAPPNADGDGNNQNNNQGAQASGNDDVEEQEVEEAADDDTPIPSGAPQTETESIVQVEKQQEQDAKKDQGFDAPFYDSYGMNYLVESVPRNLGIFHELGLPIPVYIPVIQSVAPTQEMCCVQDEPVSLTFTGNLIFLGNSCNEKFTFSGPIVTAGAQEDGCNVCCEPPPPCDPNYSFTYTNCNGQAYIDITIKIPTYCCDSIQTESLDNSDCYKTVEYKVFVLPGFLPDCDCHITEAISNVIKADSIYDFVSQTQIGSPILQTQQSEDGYGYHVTHFIDECGVCWSIMPVYSETPAFSQIQSETSNLYLVPFCVQNVEYDSICSYSNSYENECGYFSNNSSDGHYGYYSSSNGVEKYADVYVNINFAEFEGNTLLLFNFYISGAEYDINSSHWGSNQVNLAVDVPDDMGFDANSLNQFILCSHQFFNDIFSTETSKEILCKIAQDIIPDNQLSTETTLCLALQFLQTYTLNTQNPCSNPGYGILEDIFNNAYKLCVDGNITSSPFQAIDYLLPDTYLTNVALCDPSESNITNINLCINYCGSDIVDRFNCWQKFNNCDSPYGDPLKYVEDHLNAHYVSDCTQSYIEINYDVPTNPACNGYYESETQSLRICLDGTCIKDITELTINADALFQNYYENGYVNFCQLLNPYNETPLFYLEDSCGNCYEVKPTYDKEEGPIYCNLELLPCCCQDPVYGTLINQVYNVCLNGNTISTSYDNNQYQLDFSYIHNQCGTFLKVNETYYDSSGCPQTSCELINITDSNLDCCCTIKNFVLDANDLSNFVYNFYHGDNSTPITIDDFLNYFSNCGNLDFYDCHGNCYSFAETYYGESGYEFALQPCENCYPQNVCIVFETDTNMNPDFNSEQSWQDCQNCFDQFFNVSSVNCNGLSYIDFTWHYNQFDSYNCGEFTPQNCFKFPIYTDHILISAPDNLELNSECYINKIVIPQEFQCDFQQFFQNCSTLSDTVNACTGNQFVQMLSCDRILLESTCGNNYIIDKTCKGDYSLVEVDNAVRTTTLTDENCFSTHAFTGNFQDDLNYATTGDGGTGLSLREAIILANEYGPDYINTILLQNGTYTLTIGGTGENQCATGDLDVLTNLQIIGGCDGTTIDANRIDRVFEVGGSEGDFSTLTLRDLSAQNGYVVDENGGGVNLNPYSNLVLDNASIKYCETNQSEESEGGPVTYIGGNGGGVYGSYYTNVTLNDCSSISSNTSGAGGGVALSYQGNLTLNDSSTIGGDGQNYAAYSGGGVYQNYYSTTTLNDNSSIDNNYVNNGGGGGIFSSSNSSVVLNNDSEIANNSSNAGAGIYEQYGSAIVMNDAGSIHNNTANNIGGGLYTYMSSVNLNNDSTIANNSANSLWGGGIYDGYASTINLHNNSLITNNYSGQDGGGIYAYSTNINLYNDSGITLNTTNYDGGGIYDYYANTNLFGNSSISNNTVYNGGGGGIYDYNGNLTLYSDTSIDHNSAYYGGGVYTYFTNLSLDQNSSINNNQAYDGGGLFGYYSSVVLNDASQINSNQATNDGGGVHAYGYYSSYSLTLNDFSSINNNHADNNGGGVNAYGATITLNDSSTITQNVADYDNNSSGTGGGIYDQSSSNTITGGAAVTGNSPDNIATPLVLDLNHDNAIQLISLENSQVAWDLKNDGNLVKTGWVGPEDGLLVYDKNHDGKVTDVSQFMFSIYSPDAKTDLEGLKLAFDTNHDGIFDSKDEHFKDFGVWQDLNGDGKTEAGEYRSLIDWGIQSVSLNSDNKVSLQEGNLIFGNSTYQTTDGNSYKVADVGLNVQSMPTLTTNDVLKPENNIASLDSTTQTTACVSGQCATASTTTTTTSVDSTILPPLPVTQHVEEQHPVTLA
ncbi:MAG: hypothetical protein JSR17_08155 [Proteobacteria bacterium]|nr:hypothetical protein [Pseudomonadota bacterium]